MEMYIKWTDQGKKIYKNIQPNECEAENESLTLNKSSKIIWEWIIYNYVRLHVNTLSLSVEKVQVIHKFICKKCHFQDMYI